MTTTPRPVSSRSLLRGVIAEVRSDAVVVAVPDTDYRVLLMAAEGHGLKSGDRVKGVASAQARRIDAIKSGGAYLEPVNGRPRRVQGRIIDVDVINDTITVFAGAGGIVCRCNGIQNASIFEPDQLVTFDVEPGATFTPAP